MLGRQYNYVAEVIIFVTDIITTPTKLLLVVLDGWLGCDNLLGVSWTFNPWLILLPPIFVKC